MHAIDATPARWRGGAGSSSLDGASTAASSPGNEFVKSTWDAAPRTEHAVLAAGEALEVTSAAHFCCVSWLFCVLIAPLRATSGQPPKAGCSVHSLQAIAESEISCE